jgi:hypothetical protein
MARLPAFQMPYSQWTHSLDTCNGLCASTSTSCAEPMDSLATHMQRSMCAQAANHTRQNELLVYFSTASSIHLPWNNSVRVGAYMLATSACSLLNVRRSLACPQEIPP